MFESLERAFHHDGDAEQHEGELQDRISSLIDTYGYEAVEDALQGAASGKEEKPEPEQLH